MSLTKEKLHMTGWVSVANAIFTIPAIAMSFFLESMEGTEIRLAQAILIVVGLGLFVYLLSSLRQLLKPAPRHLAQVNCFPLLGDHW